MSNIINNLDILPPDFKIVSIVGELFNLQAFIEYSVYINLYQIQNFNFNLFINTITEDEKKLIIFIIYLPLALMFKNPRMQNYIFDILKKGGYDVEFETFTKNINIIYNISLNNKNQSGGGDFMKYIYALGAIFFAAFYNYYIVTIGSQVIIKDFERVQEMTSLFTGTCNIQYKPSHWVSIASKFTKDPSIIQKIEHIIQCAEMPTFFGSELVEAENRRQLPLLLDDFESQIKDLGYIKPIYNNLKELPAPDSHEKGQLVIFGADIEEINSKLMNELVVKSNKQQEGQLVDLDQIKKLTNLPPNEFRKLIEPNLSIYPTPSPNAAPFIIQATDFASDIIGAIKEISPSGAVPSLDPKNLLFWTLQDKLRDLQRKIEDTQKDTTRKVSDIIIELERIGVNFTSIPSIILYLIGINSAALTAIIFFAKKIFGSKPVVKVMPSDVNNSDKDIDNLTKEFNNIGPLHGGRTPKRKTYHKTHKRNRGIKKKQTKSKKGCSFTRK